MLTETCHCSSWLRFSICQIGTSGTYQDRGGEVLEPRVTCPPPFPQLPLRPQLSPDCQDLLRRLLERDPGRRISFQDFFAHPWVDLDHMPSEESLAQAVSRPLGMGWGESRLGVSSILFGGKQGTCPQGDEGGLRGPAVPTLW